MRYRLPRFKNVPGQLQLVFERPVIGRRRMGKTSKVSISEFDPAKHAIGDLDLRTIPRKQHTKHIVACLTAAVEKRSQ